MIHKKSACFFLLLTQEVTHMQTKKYKIQPLFAGFGFKILNRIPLTACAVSLTLEEPTEEQRDLINAHPEGCGFWAWLFEYTGLRMGEANGLQWKMVAQQLLGHSDIMTTRRIYQHLREKENARYTAQLDAYVSGKI